MQGQGNGRAFARERRALGRAVKETRARRGISQEELGYRATLHRNYVGAMERGELNPTWRTLLLFASGLDVPLSGLVGVYERQLADDQTTR